MDLNYEPVPKFYAGRSVFITGGAGFLGKVLVEKLLYSCPDLDKVFVLLRDKKSISAEQRLLNIIDLPLFSRLRNVRPQDLKKIILLKGDIMEHNLNISEEDLKIIYEKVSVVIHTAASIKFNDSLKTALRTNLEGTKNVLNLCHQITNLKVFVHVSTAYCNTDQAVIEEYVYPPPASVEDAYKLAGQDHDETTIVKFLCGRPNTYTFTKAMSEHMVSENHGKIPTVIIRPSIVTSSKAEPTKGWIDNWFGATGLITAIAKGICRVVYTSDNQYIDLIPVDYVCNLTLVAAAKAKPKTEVEVYNSCSSGSSNPITIGQFFEWYCDSAVKANFNDLPYPSKLVRTRHYWLVRIITLLSYIVAYVADAFARLGGNRPKYTKFLSQAVQVRSALNYFTFNSWVIKTEKSEALFRSLSPSDAKLYPFLARDINWREYIEIYFQGVKKYLMEKKA